MSRCEFFLDPVRSDEQCGNGAEPGRAYCGQHLYGDTEDVPQPLTDDFETAARLADDREPTSWAPVDRIRAKIVTTDQLRSIPPPKPIVDGLLYRDSLAMAYGPSGVGKSHVAMDIANHVGCRPFWHGNRVTNGAVLYVVAEGSPGASLRATAWETHYGEPSPVLWHPGAISVFDPVWASALAEVTAELEAVLVVIDTYARSIVGADENSTMDTGIAVAHLDMIREAAGCCVLIVHHAGKDTSKGARGSVALKGAMTTELEIVGGDNRITVRNTKQKDAPEAPPQHFKLAPVPGTDSVVIVQAGSIDESGELPETVFATLDALRSIDMPEGVSSTAWQAVAEVTERTFYRHRAGLVGRGYVVNVGTDKQPKYRPADGAE